MLYCHGALRRHKTLFPISLLLGSSNRIPHNVLTSHSQAFCLFVYTVIGWDCGLAYSLFLSQYLTYRGTLRCVLVSYMTFMQFLFAQSTLLMVSLVPENALIR